MITNPSGGIITKGLGLPACRGMIVNHFKLTICDVTILEPPASGGTGGSKPLAPGEIQDFFTPVEAREVYNQNLPKNKDLVVVRVQFKGNRINERQFLVQRRYAKAAVKVATISNQLHTKLKVMAKNLEQAWKRKTIDVKFHNDDENK